MPTITRRFEFDAGHRVLGHEGKCRYLHGHHYVAEVTVRAAALDNLGRVVDFSVIKEKVGKWIDDNWDHNILLHPDDPLLFCWGVEAPLSRHNDDLCVGDVIGDKKPFIMSEGQNPTAENMAAILFIQASGLLNLYGPAVMSTMTVTGVRLYETPNCWADYPDR